MYNRITGLDHVLVAVRDLDAAAAAWTRLGFVLSPRGGHPQWGTANRCAMLEGNYLELIGVSGRGAVADRIAGFLAEHGEGITGIALGTNDGAGARQALLRSGVKADVPRSLSRSLEMPDGPVTPRFSIVDLPADALPGVPAFLCQHLTPELLRRPEWLAHPNRARRIVALTAVVDDPESLIPRYEAVFGPGSAVATDNTVAVHTGQGLIFLCRPDELTQLHPDGDLDDLPPAVPSIVAISLSVADTDRAAGLLDANGVAFDRDSEGTIRIPAREATGVLVEMLRG